MALYHLVYFDVRAKGESIRVLLHLAGVPYTEERFWQDTWPTIKTSGRCPFGQVPVLEFSDGRRLCQSRAIIRFLAKEHGLAPSGNYKQARTDMLTGAISDLEMKIQSIYYSDEDKEQKASRMSKFYSETLPQQIKYLNTLLQENPDGKGYFVGDKISYADVDFFCFFNGWIGGGKLEVPEQLKDYPLLIDLYNKVMNEPRIMDYLKHRKPNIAAYPY